jgi:hypothetical protein
MTKRRRYQHNPKAGETRSPMTEGSQRGPHSARERDPHEPLARSESKTPEAVGRDPEKEGMGTRPTARGERRARRAMPAEDD